MIRCPDCGSDTSVSETRDSTTCSRRRRICQGTACGKKFTTYEFTLHNPSRRSITDMVLVHRADLDKLQDLLATVIGDAKRTPLTPDDEPIENPLHFIDPGEIPP